MSLSAPNSLRSTAHVRRVVSVVLALLVWAAVSAPRADAAAQYRGINMHALWSSVSNSDMDRELDLAKQAGANVVRVDVGWMTLEERGKGQLATWYVDKLDRFVNAADSRGIRVIPTLWATPCWASSAPETLKQSCAGSWWDRGVQQYPPVNPADYGDIARWITGRYGSKLAALEVWNEPSLDGTRFWNGPNRAAAYVAILKSAFASVNAASSSVDVLVALDGTDRAFMGALYDQGARGNYDGIAAHPYGDREFSGLKALRDLQRQRGDDKPLWVTEFGWATGGSNQVDAATQATRITEAFTGLDTLDYVRSAVLYELRDEGSDGSSTEDNYGVVKRDFTPKPGYSALRTALSGQAPPTDGTLPPVDTTLPPVDTTLPPVDTTLPPVDTTVPPVDTTVPPVDTTVPPTDGTTPPADSGSGSSDGGGDEVTLDVVRRGRKLVAVGTAPAGATVEIKREGCRSASDSTVSVKADDHGDFEVTLGKRTGLVDCKFTAALA